MKDSVRQKYSLKCVKTVMAEMISTISAIGYCLYVHWINTEKQRKKIQNGLDKISHHFWGHF